MQQPMVTDPFLWEEIEDARRMSPAEKFFAGADLFDYACSITLAGIKYQNPGIDDDKALAMLRDRVALAERLEKIR